MKKQVLAALALMSVAAASCKMDVESVPALEFGEEFIISADCGTPDTRMERDGSGNMYWNPGDEIGVFLVQDGSMIDRNERFSATLEAPACSTRFRAVVPDGQDQSTYVAYLKELWGYDGLDRIAIYPYVAGRNGGYQSSFQPPSSYINRFTTNLPFPDVQHGIPGTFDPSCWVAMAWSQDDHFSFKYPFGGIKFSVVSENVSKVTVTCGAKYKNDNFGGAKVDVSVYSDGRCLTTAMDAPLYQSLELIPQGGTFIPGQAYYFVIPSTSLMGGIDFTFEKADGSAAKRSVVPSGGIMFDPGVFKTLMEADSGCEWKANAPEVTPTDIQLQKYGGEASFDVKCSVAYTVECNEDWLVDMGGTGDAIADKCTHTFVVKRNYGAARTATINVVSEGGTVPVTVSQAAGEPLANYPSIVRHHLVLATMSTECNSGANPSPLLDAKKDYGDLFEYVCIFDGASHVGNECLTEHAQYKVTYPDYYYFFDGRRQVKSRLDMIPVFAAESDDVYPAQTSVGISSSVDGKKLSVDLSVYAYTAQYYRIAVYVLANVQYISGTNVWGNNFRNVSQYKLNDDKNNIAGALHNLSKGTNSIHFERELPVAVDGTNYSILAYVLTPFDLQPVIRDGNYQGTYYVDNCRLVPVGTTVAPEVQ